MNALKGCFILSVSFTGRLGASSPNLGALACQLSTIVSAVLSLVCERRSATVDAASGPAVLGAILLVAARATRLGVDPALLLPLLEGSSCGGLANVTVTFATLGNCLASPSRGPHGVPLFYLASTCIAHGSYTFDDVFRMHIYHDIKIFSNMTRRRTYDACGTLCMIRRITLF